MIAIEVPGRSNLTWMCQQEHFRGKMTSSTDEKDEGRELEARVVVVEGVEKQVSGGLCDNFAEEEEKVVFIFCANENPWSWVNFHT